MSYAVFLRSRQQDHDRPQATSPPSADVATNSHLHQPSATTLPPPPPHAHDRPAPRPWLTQPASAGAVDAPRPSSTGGARPSWASRGANANQLATRLESTSGQPQLQQTRQLVEPEPEPELAPELALGAQSHNPFQAVSGGSSSRTSTGATRMLPTGTANTCSNAVAPNVVWSDVSTALGSSVMQRSPLAILDAEHAAGRLEARRRAELAVAKTNIADRIAARIVMDKQRLAAIASQQRREAFGAEDLGIGSHARPSGADISANAHESSGFGNYQQAGNTADRTPLSRGATALPIGPHDDRLSSPDLRPSGALDMDESVVHGMYSDRAEAVGNGAEFSGDVSGMCHRPHSLMNNEDQAGSLARQRLRLGAGRGVGGGNLRHGDSEQAGLTPLQRAAAAVVSLVQKAVDDPGYYGNTSGDLTVEDIAFVRSQFAVLCSTI